MMYFVWQSGPKGPVNAVYHDDPPPKSAGGLTILATHVMTKEEEARFREGDLGFHELSRLYPAPEGRND